MRVCGFRWKLLVLRSKAQDKLLRVPSHRMYQLNGFRKSIPPRNRQIIVPLSPIQNQVDGLVGELTFQEYSINTPCEIRLLTANPKRKASPGITPASLTPTSIGNNYFLKSILLERTPLLTRFGFVTRQKWLVSRRINLRKVLF